MEIDKNIQAYEAVKAELEKTHLDKWVLFHDCEMTGVFDTLEEAAEKAVSLFGSGPYLIRQVGAPPVALPASVMYAPVHG